MDLLKFTFRLLKHSVIFVFRVAGIFLPVVGGALANVRTSASLEKDEWHGIPNLDAVEHPMWEETYGPHRKPW
jgi:hypothetical protein